MITTSSSDNSNNNNNRNLVDISKYNAEHVNL
jgi:hypothetical protein